MAMNEGGAFISDKRYYVNKAGEVVSEDDPSKTRLLVAKGGKLPAAEAQRYGLPKEFGEVSKEAEETGAAMPREPFDQQRGGESKAVATSAPETKALRPADAGVQDKAGVVAPAAVANQPRAGAATAQASPPKSGK